MDRETTAVAVIDRGTGIETVGALRERMEFEAARIAEMKAFVNHHMTPDIDYGVIPGTKKPTLFKPGAEIMAGIYRLDPDYHLVESYEPERVKNWSRPVKKWDAGDKRMKSVYKDGQPMMEQGQTVGRYEVRACCTLRHIGSGSTVGQGIGSCNSWETKYLTADLDDAKNTVLKMAQKRAYVAAVLSACRLSAFFTQDMEDIALPVDDTPQAPAPALARREPRPVSKEASNFVDGVTRPKTAEPDEPGSHDGPEVYQGPVIQVTAKSGNTKGKAWTFHTVEGADRFSARTFDQKVADVATEAMTQKTSVRIEYESVAGKGNKIIGIMPIS